MSLLYAVVARDSAIAFLLMLLILLLALEITNCSQKILLKKLKRNMYI